MIFQLSVLGHAQNGQELVICVVDVAAGNIVQSSHHVKNSGLETFTNVDLAMAQILMILIFIILVDHFIMVSECVG